MSDGGRKCEYAETDEGWGPFSFAKNCKCTVTGISLPIDDPKVKRLCYPDADEKYAYEQCSIYKEKR